MMAATARGPVTNARARVRAWRAGVVLALGALAAGCSISEEQERELGESNAREINAQLPLVTDPVIAEYVTALGRRLAGQTSRRDLDWRFHVVDNLQVNAFAVPGGFIYVNRGLIERTESMSELAGVLGHEIGHVVLRHSVKQMEKQGTATVGVSLLCTLTGMCSSEMTQVAINVAGAAWFARHSRADEAEADSFAVANVLQAGISPEGIPTMFRTLMQERRSESTLVGGWFASHPLEEDRIRATRELVRDLGAARLDALVDDTPDFQRFKARLAALPAPRQDALPPGTNATGAPDAEHP